MTNETKNSGDPTACSAGDLSKQPVTSTFENTKLNVIPLNWKEVYYTNCPLVSASNVDQELGWTKEEFKKTGPVKCVKKYTEKLNMTELE